MGIILFLVLWGIVVDKTEVVCFNSGFVERGCVWLDMDEVILVLLIIVML